MFVMFIPLYISYNRTSNHTNRKHKHIMVIEVFFWWKIRTQCANKQSRTITKINEQIFTTRE